MLKGDVYLLLSITISKEKFISFIMLIWIDISRWLCIKEPYEKTLLPLLKVSLLINWHMRPYSWKSKEDKEKAKKLLGPKLFNILTMLHECDEEAH